VALGLGVACSSEPASDPQQCGDTPNLEVDADATPQSSDGGVQVIGRTAFAPVTTAGTAGASAPSSTGVATDGPSERAVYDVYVGGERVTNTDFNFRTWTVNISRPELCAYSTDGTQARLPIRVYLAGPGEVCVFEVPTPVTVPLAMHTCDSMFDAGDFDAGG
jgi:hypothetical protein